MQRTLTQRALMLLMALFLAFNMNAQTLYVDQAATGLANGSDWDNAYTDLSTALTAAAGIPGGCEIWVAEGTYLPTSKAGNGALERDKAFVLTPNTRIYGGFSPAENVTAMADRDWLAYPTTLSGDIGTPGDNTDNSYHVVIAAGATGTALLDGFIITGGNANDSSTTITVNGQAIYRRDGGGVVVRGAGFTPTLRNLQIRNNYALYGGGIELGDMSNSTLVNVLIVENEAGTHGGGMFNFNTSAPVLTNVTITANTAPANGGNNVYNYNSSPVFNNSIIWSASNSIAGQGVNNPVYVNTLKDSDPLFVNPLMGDYRIQLASPAKNAGDNSLYNTAVHGDKDIAMNDRIYDTTIDMGAYEATPVILHVNNAYTSSGDGLTWEAPFVELSDALLYTYNHPGIVTEILVAEGTYRPIYSAEDGMRDQDGLRSNAFVLPEGVKIYGGFSFRSNNTTTMDDRNWTLYPTTLTGNIGVWGDNTDNCYHVVVATNIPNNGETVLDGFHITGGNANGAGNTIPVNTTAFVYDFDGGGIDLVNASPVLRNLYFYDNYAKYGGAVQTENSSPKLLNVFMYNNEADYAGAGVYSFLNSKVELINVTIANATPITGGLYSDSEMKIYNSIIWNDVYLNDTYNHTVENSLILDLDLTVYPNNLADDPMFVDFANADLRLMPSSPAIDAGDDAWYALAGGDLLNDTDVNGNPRLMRGAIDMGAFEAYPPFYWLGIADKDWSNSDNWGFEDPLNPGNYINPNQVAPDQAFDVVFLGNAGNYPVLTAATKVNDILFEMGSELKGQHLLTYNKANVQFNLGHYPSDTQVNASLTSPMLARDRFYLITAPLKDMVVGDFFFGGKPDVYVRYAETVKTDLTKDLGEQISLTKGLPYYDVKLNPGFGFAYMIEGKDAKTSPEQANIDQADGIVTYPRFMNEVLDGPGFNHHEGFDASLNESTFHYFFFKQPDNRVPDALQAPDVYTRSMIQTRPDVFAGYRLAAENEISDTTPASFTLDINAPMDENDVYTGGDLLVGNPYLSHLDFQAFYLANPGIESYFRLWDGRNAVSWLFDATTGNFVSSTNGTAPSIAPMQAFFVAPTDRSAVSNPATFNFTESMSVVGADNQLRSDNLRETLRITATGKTDASSVVILRGEEGNGVSKLFSMYPEVPELYLVAGDKGLVYEIAEISNATTSVLLGLSSGVRGETITLSFEGMQTISTPVYLYDEVSRQTIELAEGANYEFVNRAGSEGNRFYILFGPQAPNAIDTPNEATINVYAENQTLHVNSTPQNRIDAVKIYSLDGKTMDVISQLNTISYQKTLTLNKGVYMVEVVAEQGAEIHKVILK